MARGAATQGRQVPASGGRQPARLRADQRGGPASEPASTHPLQGAKRGPKPKLALEDRLLLLMYYREYRTFAHVGASFGVSETHCWRIVTALEARLLADARFHLARKQALRGDTHWQGVVMDVGECVCERPTKSGACVPPGVPIFCDTGYQGLQKLPAKATKKRPLTPEQKRANQAINSERVVVEHAIRRLKVFRRLGERYRNRRRRFGLRLNLIAALTNLE